MSGKRQASYNIDPNTLEEKQKDQQQPIQLQGPSGSRAKQQRKIFKIKRPGQGGSSQQNQSKISFKLNESQQIKPSNNDSKQDGAKNQSKQSQPVNPFANLNLFKADKNIFNGIGIFSSLSNNNIFTSNKGTQQSAQAKANPNAGKSIFSSTGTNLFDNSALNTAKTSNNSIKNTGASLFGQKTVQNNDDDGSGDSAQLQKIQKIQADPSKSKAKYEYQQNCHLILKNKVLKYKRVGGILVQNIDLILQKQKQKDIKYITIQLPATKRSIFTGILVQGKSQIRHINGKPQNVEVTAFVKEKEKFIPATLKFQYEKPEMGENLFKVLLELGCIQKIVEQQPKPEQIKQSK